MDIIQYLLSVIQYLYQQNCWLINFICRYIPLRQLAFDDSYSPKYQKFKIDELPPYYRFPTGLDLQGTYPLLRKTLWQEDPPCQPPVRM